MENIKCKNQSARGIILFLFLVFYFLFPASHLAFAGGKIYWTPDGVLVNNFNDGVGSPIDDAKGGAILFSIRPYGISQDSVVALRIDRNGNSLWGLQGRTLDNYAGWQGWVKGVSDGRGGAIAFWVRLPSEIYYYQRVDSMGNRMWGSNAQRVTLSDSAQWDPAVVSDGAGGMIIAWQEIRNGRHIYAQRIDSSGNRLWGNYGILIVSGPNQVAPAMISNGKKGTLIAWSDMRDGDWDIYCQQIDSLGNALWGAGGVGICLVDSGQFVYDRAITSDLVGGGIICWVDKRGSDYDIYAQAVDSNGVVKWQTDGVPICTTIANQWEPAIVTSDGQGGAVVLWGDHRNSIYRDIYAQRVDENGAIKWQINGCAVCIADSNQEKPSIVSDGNSGAIICWQDKRSGNWDIYAQHVDSSGTVLWDTNGMAVCTAINDQQYQEMIASDSNTAIISWLDYRNGSSQARGYAQKVGDIVVGISEMMQDARCKIQDTRLKQNYPNPFAYTTKIKYCLGQRAECIVLQIYDVSGRLVRTLFNDFRDPGVYEITWDGRDDSNCELPTGVYFCQLNVGVQYLTKKLVLLK